MTERANENKTERILKLYQRLLEGEIVNKAEAANEFSVNMRSIQRDIDDLRAYLSNDTGLNGNLAIMYDYRKKGYMLNRVQEKMTGSELLAVCKILLESRAFTKLELDSILSKLLRNCSGGSISRQVEGLIANEQYHYVELNHHKAIVSNLMDIGMAIKNSQYMEITYQKLKEKQPVARMIKPVGIVFSEFYFYLIAFIDQSEEEYLSPAIYRIDRIQSYKVLERHFVVPYRDRFEEGEFRKRVQFMYGGKLQRIVFEYSGLSVEAVLDRLPTAVILEEQNGTYTIRAEVFGDGIDRWIRSQGEELKVVSRKVIK